MSSNETTFISGRYLDASAAVKLVVAEQASDAVRKFVASGGPFYIISICLAEALSVLKVKYLYRQELSEKEYYNAANLLLDQLQGSPIFIEDVNLVEDHVFYETKALAQKYKLDLSDALQLYVLKRGKWSSAGGRSKSMLITGDKELGNAALSEGYKVWNCLTDPLPAEIT